LALPDPEHLTNATTHEHLRLRPQSHETCQSKENEDMDAPDRRRVIVTFVVGCVLVVGMAAVSLLSLSVAECAGAADCWRDNERRTVVALAAPLVAAAVLIAGAVVAVRARRARPLFVALVVMVSVYVLWWSLPGWSPLVVGALVTAAAIVVAARSSRPSNVTPGTPSRL